MTPAVNMPAPTTAAAAATSADIAWKSEQLGSMGLHWWVRIGSLQGADYTRAGALADLERDLAVEEDAGALAAIVAALALERAKGAGWLSERAAEAAGAAGAAEGKGKG